MTLLDATFGDFVDALETAYDEVGLKKAAGVESKERFANTVLRSNHL